MTPSARNAGGGRVARWSREQIIEKIREWNDRYGEPPCSADWNPSLARWRAQEWRAERPEERLPCAGGGGGRAGLQAGRGRRARERSRATAAETRELSQVRDEAA